MIEQVYKTKQSCPSCGGLISVYQTAPDQKEQRPAKPGDLMICTHCGEILEFSNAMIAQRISDITMAMLSPRIRVQLAEARETILRKIGRSTRPRNTFHA